MTISTKIDIRAQPSIYVACLTSYNNGILYGAWIDATTGHDSVMEQIQTMLVSSPEPDAEEWAIHDTSGFEGINLDSYSLEETCEIAEKLVELSLETSGLEEAFPDFLLNHDTIEGAFESLKEAFLGQYDSELDFVYEYVEDTCMLDGCNETAKRYFDYEYFLKDLKWGGDIFFVQTRSHDVLAFRSY